MYWVCVGKVLVMGALQGWPLWEGTRSFPHIWQSTGGEEVENWGVKVSLGRKETWGEGVLRFSFYFSLTWSNLISNKLISLRWVCSPVAVTGEWCLPVILSRNKQRAFLLFLCPVQLGEAVTVWLWWVPGIRQGQPTTNSFE